MDKKNNKTERARAYFKKCAEENNGTVPFYDFVKYIIDENPEYITEADKALERARLLDESVDPKNTDQC